MKLIKFVALYDIHIGWEKGKVGGNWVTRPTHNKSAIRAVTNFINDFSPDVILLGGDQLNAGPISHWHHGRPILDAGFRLKNEMDTLDELILDPFDKISRKIFMTGNHEAWIESHVEENPGLQGLIEPEAYLKLQDRKWELYSQGEIAQIGKLYFVHGDTILGKGTGVNPAKTLVNAYRRNIRAGHIHTYSAAVEVTAIDATDYHSGVIIPSLSTKNPFFVKNNPNTFINGFDYGYVWDNGDFSDEVVIVNKGTFTVNGKRYKP